MNEQSSAGVLSADCAVIPDEPKALSQHVI